MPYEYRIVPAPGRGAKQRGLKTPEARFAASVEQVINEMAAEGWEYQRTDALPSEERSGLTHTHTVWRHLLVFRRGTVAQAAAAPDVAQGATDPRLAGPIPAPAADSPAVQDAPAAADPASPPKLTATRDEPRRRPRFSPPREDPEIATPVRKLFAGPPQTHRVQTHPDHPDAPDTHADTDGAESPRPDGNEEPR